MSTSVCPKCQTTFRPGRWNNKFCSRSCANSRVFSDASKKKKSLSNKGRAPWHKGKTLKTPKSKICPITKIDLTGLSPLHQPFWCHPSKRRFLVKVCDWFDIPVCCETTRGHLDNLQNEIKTLYELGYSSIQIKEHFNIPLPNGHMPAFLKQLGIPVRSLSDAIRNGYKTGRCSIPTGDTKYEQGWHTDWRGEKQYYRSSYERQVMEFLDLKKRNYRSESLRITYTDSRLDYERVAIPDFLVDDDLIIEVKSSYTYDSHNMADKFSAYKDRGYRPLLLLDGVFWRRLPESNRSHRI